MTTLFLKYTYLYEETYMYGEMNICKKCFNCHFNSISAKGNIELFANNADSDESARNELSHLKSALFGRDL